MIEWVTAVVLATLAVAAGLPAVLRAVSLSRFAPHQLETHGAANDPRFWPAWRRDEPVERVRATQGGGRNARPGVVAEPRSWRARVDFALMQALDQDALSKLSPESERAFRKTFLEDPATGRIRLTRTGRTAYGTRFARAGIDIEQVRTRTALREACIRSEWVVYEEIRRLVEGHKGLEAILEPLWSRP